MAKSTKHPKAEGVKPDLAFSRQGWEDYQHWARTDRKTAGRIARLVEACLQDPFQGIGHPEPLKHEFAGIWSRRITQEHRLVYKVDGDVCLILQCRYHY